MRILFTLFTGLFLLSNQLPGQSAAWNQLPAAHKEVVQVVIEVFNGMRAGDSVSVKKHFYHEVSSYSAFTSEQGKKELRAGDVNNWFNAIGKPHDQIWDERIWDYQVQIDGNLAAVWVNYAFYLGQELHHCGVDAIQLANDGERWKIFHIADTRQTDSCIVPENIASGATY